MNTEKYNLKKTKILTLIIILSTMIINGCLTLQYYPAKVAKPGKMYLGLGIHEENFYGFGKDYSNSLMIYDALFFRCGLPCNFDIGFGIHSLLVFPYMLSINARKQFDINNYLINSITFDAGFGIAIGAQCYTSISLIRNDYALTFGLKKFIIPGDPFSGTPSSYRTEFLLKIAKEFEYKRFNIMPILYYKATQEYYAYPYDFQTYITYMERTGWSNKQIGIGVSFYFDLL